jgi:hypothetical protein
MKRRIIDFQTIRSEGGLLPPDLLRRVKGLLTKWTYVKKVRKRESEKVRR